MPFLFQSFTAALLCLLLWGLDKIIFHSNSHSIFKVLWKGLSLILTEKGQIPTLIWKIPLTYFLRKQPDAHTKWWKYLRFWKPLHLFGQRRLKCTPISEPFYKFFWAIFFIPVLVLTEKLQVIGCFEKNFLIAWKILLPISTGGRQMHPP